MAKTAYTFAWSVPFQDDKWIAAKSSLLIRKAPDDLANDLGNSFSTKDCSAISPADGPPLRMLGKKLMKRRADFGPIRVEDIVEQNDAKRIH